MEEIKLGEYVRFKDGEIGKIIDIKEDPPRVVYSEYGEIGLVADIAKHSPNIIDLIEVGDICIIDDDFVYLYDEEFIKAIFEDTKRGCKLKSIVTKEQFANIEYKI